MEVEASCLMAALVDRMTGLYQGKDKWGYLGQKHQWEDGWILNPSSRQWRLHKKHVKVLEWSIWKRICGGSRESMILSDTALEQICMEEWTEFVSFSANLLKIYRRHLTSVIDNQSYNTKYWGFIIDQKIYFCSILHIKSFRVGFPGLVTVFSLFL